MISCKANFFWIGGFGVVNMWLSFFGELLLSINHIVCIRSSAQFMSISMIRFSWGNGHENRALVFRRGLVRNSNFLCGEGGVKEWVGCQWVCEYDSSIIGSSGGTKSTSLSKGLC